MIDADRPNPILTAQTDPVADLEAIRQAHIVLRRQRYRDIRDLRRKQTAVEAVAGLDLDGRETYGLTKGQFSFVDLIEAILARTGPAALELSTWTAAGTNVTTAIGMIESGRITRARWLVDASFVRRCPQLAARLRAAFGNDSIRVTRTHAKFAVVHNATWQVVCRTSMNLNENPRLEDFTLAHDPELAGFIIGNLDNLWATQRRSLQDGTVRQLSSWWESNG
jgi:hypothetical protein